MLSINKIIKYLWQPIRKYKWTFIFSFLTYGVAVVLSGTVNPFVYKKIIDTIASAPVAELDVVRLFHLVFWAFAVIFGYNAFYRLGDYCIVYFQSGVIRELHNTTFEKILHHSYRFFTSNFSGALVAKAKRFSRSFETIHDIISFNIWFTLIRLTGAFIVLYYQAHLITYILLSWVVLYIFITFLFIRRKIKLDLLEAEADSNVTGSFADTITNILNVKIFSGAKKEISSFTAVTDDEATKRLRAWNFGNLQNLVQGFLMAVLQCLVLYTVVRLFVAGRVTIGTVVLTQTYMMGIFDDLWNLGKSLAKIFKALSEMKEIVDIFEQEIDIKDPEISEPLRIKDGAIEFRDVTFAYNDGADVFAHLDLSIAAGQKVGLVGHSGSGKSTITKLLLRFMDVQSGEIVIDGQNIAHITQNELRKQILYVPQESILFHRTIKENIMYAEDDIPESEIITAAKKAHADEFISGLSKGYDTLVGERGVKLSGGERQRVAIARVMLKHAPILILDEATSSLDSLSEKYIQDAFNELMKGKTTLVVAHRLSTVQKMDRILVLDKGAIVEDGTHQELLAKKGTYYNLWNHQVGGFIQ